MDLHRARLSTPVASRRAAAMVAAACVPIVFIGWFFVWPLVAILGRGLIPGGHVHLGPVLDVVSDGRLRHLAIFTLTQAALSTVVTIAVGIPLAGVLARRRLVGARVMRGLVLVPFVLPTVVVATAFAALLGEGGPLGSWHLVPGPAAIIGAHAWFNLAVVVRVVGARWANIDPRLVEVARVAGAKPMRAFREATLPLLAESVMAASAIVFLFCVTSFGVVLVLGGPRYGTLETEIYRLTTQELAFDRASALVLVQMLVVLVTLWVASRAARGAGEQGRLVASRDATRPLRGVRERLGVAAFLGAVLVFLLAPIVVVVARSLSGGLDAYRSMGTEVPVLAASPASTIGTSLRSALVATALAVIVGGLAAAVVAGMGAVRGVRGAGARRSRLGGALELVLLLPLGVSAVTIGFGFVIALNRPVHLRSSWWLVPIAQATVAVPFVMRTVLPALRSVDARQRDVAAVLGARPARVWREVDFPVVRRALAAAATFACAISLGEFGATAFVARADAPTMPIAIRRLLARPGATDHRTAFALAALLVVVTGVMAVAADRLGDARGGY